VISSSFLSDIKNPAEAGYPHNSWSTLERYRGFYVCKSYAASFTGSCMALIHTEHPYRMRLSFLS
jgi:hypothetical protein